MQRQIVADKKMLALSMVFTQKQTRLALYVALAVVAAVAAAVLLGGGRRDNWARGDSRSYGYDKPLGGPCGSSNRYVPFRWYDTSTKRCRGFTRCRELGGQMIAMHDNDGKRVFSCYRSQKWEGKVGRGALACKNQGGFATVYDTKLDQCKFVNPDSKYDP